MLLLMAGLSHACLSIVRVCLQSPIECGNGLGVIIVFCLHCPQHAPCLHVVGVPLHLQHARGCVWVEQVQGGRHLRKQRCEQL